MGSKPYAIVSETTEDRFDEADTLEAAVRIARSLARDTGEPVLVEHKGRVIRHLVRQPGGGVTEQEVG
jgi:hypothetical protein